MKNRILSFVLALALIASTILGTAIFAGAENTDGLKKTAISLAENVTLKMEVAIAEPSEGAYAKIIYPNGTVDDTQLVANAPMNGDNYVFTAEVAVKDLEEIIIIEICDKDGNAFIEDATSAIEYCSTYKELYPNGEFLDLIEALKAYSEAAKIYFDENATAPAAAAADFSAVADVKTAGTLPAGLTHRSAALLLESETTLRHYFELADGKNIGDYTFFVDLDKDGVKDPTETLTVASKSTQQDGKTVYFVDIEGITPNELDDVYTLVVTDGEATYSCEYGALTYLKRAYANGGAKTKNLAAALLNYSNTAGELTGTITFNVGDGEAVAAQTYEYGIDFPIIATTSSGSKIFRYWADADGNKVDTIPANATGDVTLTAVWKEGVTEKSWNKAMNRGAGNFGYCANHVDGNDEDAFCDNCKYCIEQCDGETCSKCGKTTTVKDHGIFHMKAWQNQSYVAKVTKNGISGNEFGFKSYYSGNAPFGTYTGNSYAGAIESGCNQIIYTYTLARADDGTQVLPFYNRIRAKEGDTTVDEVSLFAMNTEGEWKILGGDSGVYITTEPHTYKIVFEVPDKNSYTFKASLYVDGVCAYTNSSVRTKAKVSAFGNDSFGQFRISGTGKLWFGTEVRVDAVYNANLLDLGLGDVPMTYTTGTAVALPDLTADGVVFGGWYKDAAYTQPIYELPANSYDYVTLYPKVLETLMDSNMAQYTESAFHITENICKHLIDPVGLNDGDGFCKECGAHIHTDVAVDNCPDCGYAVKDCGGNGTNNHTDNVTLALDDKSKQTADVADGYCDVCGLKINIGKTGSSFGTPNVVNYYAGSQLVVDESGNYLRVSSPWARSANFNISYGTSIYNLLKNRGDKTISFVFNIAKDPDFANNLAMNIRTRNSSDSSDDFTLLYPKADGSIKTHDGQDLPALLDGEMTEYGVVLDFNDAETNYIHYYVNGEYKWSESFSKSLSKFTGTGGRFLNFSIEGGTNAASRYGEFEAYLGNYFA